MANKKWDFRKITLEDMMTYIEKNAPQDKEWFKSIAINDKGVYQHLVAVRGFCERYMPEIIPVKKIKESKADMLKNW